MGQQRTSAVHTGSETVEPMGDSTADLTCSSTEDYAVLLTPQKNGNGPFTIPETFLRQT
jgi:hypothetical protein